LNSILKFFRAVALKRNAFGASLKYKTSQLLRFIIGGAGKKGGLSENRFIGNGNIGNRYI
jgi:hypothetical protein